MSLLIDEMMKSAPKPPKLGEVIEEATESVREIAGKGLNVGKKLVGAGSYVKSKLDALQNVKQSFDTVGDSSRGSDINVVDKGGALVSGVQSGAVIGEAGFEAGEQLFKKLGKEGLKKGAETGAETLSKVVNAPGLDVITSGASFASGVHDIISGDISDDGQTEGEIAGDVISTAGSGVATVSAASTLLGGGAAAGGAAAGGAAAGAAAGGAAAGGGAAASGTLLGMGPVGWAALGLLAVGAGVKYLAGSSRRR